MNWRGSKLVSQQASDRKANWVLSGRFVMGGPEHTWTWSVLDLYHHAQHFYSITLSHTANCCGRYKTIWTASCFRHYMSQPPFCLLAPVVALYSPPFNVKLSVWLPSSCNAAPLIAKATTQLKVVAIRQPIRRYQILCCYRVSRQGVLNGRWLRVLVPMERQNLGLCLTSQTVGFSYSGANCEFTATWCFPQIPQCKMCPSNGLMQCHSLADSNTVDSWWADECLELANH